jgi:hypothetical protein
LAVGTGLKHQNRSLARAGVDPKQLVLVINHQFIFRIHSQPIVSGAEKLKSARRALLTLGSRLPRRYHKQSRRQSHGNHYIPFHDVSPL